MIRHVVLTYNCNKSCTYCYASNQKDYNEMSIEDFKRILDWFKERKIKKFSLIGGEPTQYKYFNEVNELIGDFSVTLLTNGLFVDKCIDNVNAFVINCNISEGYISEELKLLNSNIQKIRERTSNITLRHNIIDSSTPYEYAIDLCIKYSIKNISYSITAPNSAKSNKFTNLHEKEKLKQNILSFVKECMNHEIIPRISRPIPYCLFNHKERRFMLENGGLIGTCSPSEGVYVINPDLSVYPCSSMHFKGPCILEFNNEEKIMDFYAGKIKDLKWSRRLFNECKTCIYMRRKKCHGGCLTYKL